MHFLSESRIRVIARRLLAACGSGRILLHGDADPRLVAELRLYGCRVTVATTSETASHGTGIAADADAAHADIVFVVHAGERSMAWADVARWAVGRASRAICILLLSPGEVAVPRKEIDAALSDAGAREHPAASSLAPWSVQDPPSSERWWLYEPFPQTHTALPQAGRWLGYDVAYRFVRPGDRVLDLTGGADGVELLARMTRAREVLGLGADARADAKGGGWKDAGAHIALRDDPVTALDAGSRDFVLLLKEAVGGDRLPDAPLLQQVLRVLSPGGRFLVRHAAGGSRPGLLPALQKAGFLLERVWLSSAAAENAQPDVLLETVAGQAAPEGAFPVLVLAMKSPLSTAPETDGGSGALPNILAFARDYRYPALVRSMISIGLRATSPALLGTLADSTRQMVPRDSADAGAALCISLYLAIDDLRSDRRDGPDASEALLQAAEAYVARPHANPTGFRWRVSAAYAAGLLCLAQGALDRARALLEWSAGQSPAHFSPLLATKTVGASVLLGRIAHAEGDAAGAGRWWEQALRSTQALLADVEWREVLGDPVLPETFGMPELSAVLQQAGIAASGLRALAENAPGGGPNGMWKMLSSTQGDQLEEALLSNALLREGGEQAGQAREWLLGQVHSLEAECRRREAAIDALSADQTALLASKGWLESQVASLEAECERRGQALQALQADHGEQAQGKAWLESQVASLEAECERRGQALQALQADHGEQAQGKAWLESQVASLEAECERRGQALQALQADHGEQAQGKAWLESQVASLEAECERRGQALQALQADHGEQAQGKAWLESQVASLEAECERRGQALQALQADLDEQAQGKAWLESQVASLEAECERRGQALQADHGEQAQGKAWLESQVASLEAECERRGQALQAQQADFDEQAQGKAWLESQVTSLEAECGRLMEASTASQERLDALGQTVRQLESQLAMWRVTGEKAESESKRLEAALEHAMREAASVRVAREHVESGLRAEVSSWRKAVDEHAAALARSADELEQLRSSQERLQAELDAATGWMHRMESNRWVRLGMKAGLVRRAGDGK